MKTEIFKIKRLLPIGLLMWLAAVSCVDDNVDYTSGSGKEKDVTFSLTLPGNASGGATYALSTPDEEEVRTIEVLLFASGNYVETRTVASISDAGSIKTFTVKIPEGTYSSLVVLANSRDIVSNVSLATSDSKADALAKLNVSGSAKWVTTNTSGSYKPIPMWGEVDDITVNQSTPSLSLSLTRMLAKVSVSLTHAAAIDNFTLETIDVYNYYDKGSVAPVAANFSAGKATAASLPLGAEKPAVTDPYTTLTYSGSEITTEYIASENEIYLFESDNSRQSDLLTRTCLVLGGTYTGDGKTYYYRVDFIEKVSGTDTYIDILRNHNYKFNVTKISGPGYDSADKAFSARPFNIEATVVDWDDADIKNVATDGQYMLGVSQMEYDLAMDKYEAGGSDNQLTITTDHLDGWEISSIIDDVTGIAATWLSVASTDQSGAKGKKTISLLVGLNDSGSNRSAKVNVTAGTITIAVQVNQSQVPDLGLSIKDEKGNEISELVFAAAANVQPTAQHFTLNWAPASSDIFFSNTAIGHTFEFDTSSSQNDITNGSITGGGGSQNYTIQPTPITSTLLDIDEFYERTSVILYTVSNGISSVSKSLTLRQLVYNMVPVVDAVYLMDGGTRKYFTVKSNTPFKVTLKSNPNEVVSSLQTSGVANTSGTAVYFDIIDDLTDPVLYQRDVVVTISSPDGLFLAKDVTLNCASGIIQDNSNSYIVAPNGIGILIPVGRANESMLGTTQLGTSEAFTAGLVWTDTPHSTSPVVGIGSAGAVKMIRAVGTGSLGYVLVMPGSKEGNAVVDIQKAGKRLWSWHIWVTSYDPNTDTYISNGQTFMGRNLGAFNNTKGNLGSKGLLYQWGRKDPFPGSTTTTGNGELPIYAANSAASVTPASHSSVSNFANSVINPLTFYWNTTNYDWYGTTQNTALWGSTKTVYDPCPEGWRVPTSGATTASPWNGLAGQTFTSGTGVDWTSSSRGYYPAAGYRYNSTGALGNVGTYGCYWSASPNGTNSYCLSFGSSGGIYASSNAGRSSGFSVRCVQK